MQAGYNTTFSSLLAEKSFLPLHNAPYGDFIKDAARAGSWLDPLAFQFGIHASLVTHRISVYVAVFESGLDSPRLVLVPETFDQHPWHLPDQIAQLTSKGKIRMAFLLFCCGHIDYLEIECAHSNLSPEEIKLMAYFS